MPYYPIPVNDVVALWNVGWSDRQIAEALRQKYKRNYTSGGITQVILKARKAGKRVIYHRKSK